METEKGEINLDPDPLDQKSGLPNYFCFSIFICFCLKVSIQLVHVGLSHLDDYFCASKHLCTFQ